MAMTVFMTQWVVYKNPTDYPGQYVLRKWHIMNNSTLSVEKEPAVVSDNYDDVVEALPVGVYRMPRFNNDDPAILEVWL